MTPRTATEIRSAIVTGKLTAREIVLDTLERIHALDRRLHSFITVADDHALRQVDELERRAAAGEEPGPLWGVPFSVKDVYDTAGVRTTYGSRIFRDHVPSRDAELVSRIRRAGGILVGKTNTPEFAIYIRTVNELQPETVNPWHLSRTPGGSSGGAAASVAAALTPVAVGSDGGGSVRIPAALCGVVGLMPSRGSIPRNGGHIGTRRFSAAGPLALDAADALTLWQVMRGPSAHDGLTRGLLPTGVSAPSAPEEPPRLRWIGESGAPGAEPDVVKTVNAAARALADTLGAGLKAHSASLDSPRFAGAFYTMMQADRLSTGGQALIDNPTARDALTNYARHHLEQATQIDGAAYSAAIEMQLEATEHLDGLLEGADVLLTPTLGFVAPEIPAGPESLPEDARRGFVAFTFLMNYTGFPAATVPCGLVRGLPVGLQLIGRPGSEHMLLSLCQRFQNSIYRLLDAPTSATTAPSPGVAE
jgi:Asp-tRNA(Asn)/Glu-tRNA(Gln) amidotransferase A subunit family amidase